MEFEQLLGILDSGEGPQAASAASRKDKSFHRPISVDGWFIDQKFFDSITVLFTVLKAWFAPNHP